MDGFAAVLAAVLVTKHFLWTCWWARNRSIASQLPMGEAVAVAPKTPVGIGWFCRSYCKKSD